MKQNTEESKLMEMLSKLFFWSPWPKQNQVLNNNIGELLAAAAVAREKISHELQQNSRPVCPVVARCIRSPLHTFNTEQLSTFARPVVPDCIGNCLRLLSAFSDCSVPFPIALTVISVCLVPFSDCSGSRFRLHCAFSDCSDSHFRLLSSFFRLLSTFSDCSDSRFRLLRDLFRLLWQLFPVAQQLFLIVLAVVSDCSETCSDCNCSRFRLHFSPGGHSLIRPNYLFTQQMSLLCEWTLVMY